MLRMRGSTTRGAGVSSTHTSTARPADGFGIGWHPSPPTIPVSGEAGHPGHPGQGRLIGIRFPSLLPQQGNADTLKPMPRRFNTAGPCRPDRHCVVPSLARRPELQRLIEDEHYFVLHAARQTGKTTLLLTLAQELESSGRHRALYVTVEAAHRLDEAAVGIPAVALALREAVSCHPVLGKAGVAMPPPAEWAQQVMIYLRELTIASDLPLVLLIDEANCLGGATLISFLRQIRQGYVTRGTQPFPQSLALVGMRDIRDFKAMVRPGSDTLGSASPFNIVSRSLTLGNFSRADVEALYAQHTADTRQVFPPAVLDLIQEQTQGQPWLVNAIGRELVDELCDRNYTLPITEELTRDAIQRLILRRDTHLDSLIERLREDRVRRIVEPVILGEERALDMVADDVRYCLDLGLLRNDKGVVRPACPIYAEVIARVLSWSSQCALPVELEHRWLSPAGIDLDGLLAAFQQFWRENADAWSGRYDYAEAAPHLILMAFLQRVLNGGAQVAREFASGRKRLDLDLFYAGRHHPIELKLWRGPKSREEGLTQLAAYCASLGATDGWLVLFDRRADRTWDDRITWELVERDGRRLRLVGC